MTTVTENRFRPYIRLSIGLVLVLTIGTLGYILIEGDWTILESLYMTVITITTIGYGEVHDLSREGRIFTLFVIFLGLSLAAAFFARLGQFVVESGIKDLYGRRKMNERIKKLRNHYILCGYGRTGSSIARKLSESGIDFVIIDSMNEHIEDAMSQGYNILQGDASSDTILLEAGIRRAAGTVLCVGDDSTNVNIALAARELNTEQNIVSRGTDPSLEYRLIRAGADKVVNPMRMGGELIARSIVEEHKKSGADEGFSAGVLGYELRIVRNSDEPRTVREIMENHQAMRPVAIRRSDGSMTHNPAPGDLVGENDALLLLIHEEKKNRTHRAVQLLNWTDDLLLGVAKIDNEHKSIYKFAEELQRTVLEKHGKDAVARCYELFVTFAGSHFHREEVLMRENGYPDQESHQLEHEELSRQITGLNRNDRLDFTDETWNQIDRWFSQHFLEADKRLSDYLKSR
jgi:voltage-gated potassium channel